MAAIPPLAETLAQIDHWYAEHVPTIHATLRAGATESELDALEKHIGFTLPQDFRELYKWHDGQNWENGYVFGLEFIPLARVKTEWDVWKSLESEFGDDEVNKHFSRPTGAITEKYINAGWLAFLVDGGGNSIGVDLSPDARGKEGQIINFGRDEKHKYVLADSVAQFLREYWKRLEEGRYTILQNDDYYQIVLVDETGYFDTNGEVRTNADIYPGFGAVPAVRRR